MRTVETILNELGISFDPRGDEGRALCPFHHEKIPSWYINLNSGLHNCLSCGHKGNLAGLVSFMLGLSYAEAHSWVLSRVGLNKARQWLESKEATPEKLRLTDADLALFIPPPQFALDSRKITKEAAEKYEVLWNPKKSSWIFPIRDARDFSLMGWQEKNERRFRNYPVSCRKSETLFGLRNATDGSTVILTESPVDSARCLSSGAGTGLSSYGVQVSDKQLAIVHDVTEHLVLALDNDYYGMAETNRICREFRAVSVSVFNYGELQVKDIGDMNDEQIRWGVSNAISGIYYR